MQQCINLKTVVHLCITACTWTFNHCCFLIKMSLKFQTCLRKVMITAGQTLPVMTTPTVPSWKQITMQYFWYISPGFKTQFRINEVFARASGQESLAQCCKCLIRNTFPVLSGRPIEAENRKEKTRTAELKKPESRRHEKVKERESNCRNKEQEK